MKQQVSAFLGLLAETSIHAGTGQQTGPIDLPIQREGHTGWPCVFGSAVKGALRTKAEDMGLQGLDVVFGPDTNSSASEHAGALAVGDARLVLLPVRSLTSHFKWVTCPALLLRVKRDAERLGLPGFTGLTVESPSNASEGSSPAWVARETSNLFLEEYRFHAAPKDLQAVIQALASLSDRDAFAEELKRQLVVVEDDLFAHLCEHATPVNAHIRLKPNKTVTKGALWYEETLPPETLLYAALSAVPARKRVIGANNEDLGPAMQAADVLKAVKETLFGTDPYLQLGGNETVGMGWCRVKIVKG